MNNSELIQLLKRNMQKKVVECTVDNQPWKLKAYHNAVQQLDLLEESRRKLDVSCIESLRVGKGIQEKMIWILHHQRDLEDPDPKSSKTNQVIYDLMQIHNVGLKKAMSLVRDHSIRSIHMLRDRTDLLNTKQVVGLKYHDHIQRPIPKSEIDKHRLFLFECFQEIFSSFMFEIVGSYRRQQETSGDIDVLLCIDNDNDDHLDSTATTALKQLIATMQSTSYIPQDGVFALGPKKFMGMCKLNNCSNFRRLDILLTTKQEYPFSLLYFTGSKSFNVIMREHANKLGLCLNEKGLQWLNGNTTQHVKIEQLASIKNEKDIFDTLNLEYVQPHERYVHNFKIKNV
jgi:DNA polymerase/3'-5' exonuclease PolX